MQPIVAGIHAIFAAPHTAHFKGIFSQDCQLCGVRTPDSLCTDCSDDLPQLSSSVCPVCALVSPAGLVCGECLSAPPAFDQTIAAFPYRFPLDRLVQSFKFRENLSLAAFFSAALHAAVLRHGAAGAHALPDQVIPLPLARKRMAERGFNQAALLAAQVAGKFGLRHAPAGLLKIRDTPPQSGLDRAARLKNVRGAFECVTDEKRAAVAGLHVAIVDDVMTTGATLSEAAKVLKKAGARHVSAWVVARADRLSGQLDYTGATVPFQK